MNSRGCQTEKTCDHSRADLLICVEKKPYAHTSAAQNGSILTQRQSRLRVVPGVDPRSTWVRPAGSTWGRPEVDPG